MGMPYWWWAGATGVYLLLIGMFLWALFTVLIDAFPRRPQCGGHVPVPCNDPVNCGCVEHCVLCNEVIR